MNQKAHQIITYLIAAIWLVNGIYCKLLNLVPRHQEIVANILGPEYASELTILIGLSETIMAIWVLSRFKPRLNAITQIAIVGIMNVLEFTLVPDLLLWGKWNIVFAGLFMLLVYYHEFVLKTKQQVILFKEK